MSATAAGFDALWAALAVALGVVVLLSQHPGTSLVRLSELVRRARSVPALSPALVLGWAWLGWHFFAR